MYHLGCNVAPGGVSVQMFLQRLGSFETSRAQVTLVGESGVVASHVELHLAVVSEAFAAEIAVEWGLSSVEPDVHRVAVLINVAPLTIGADERFVDFVSFLVHEEIMLRRAHLEIEENITQVTFLFR